MKALVLAGGLGFRLRPLTQTGAKQLLPVGNKPIIHYVLENLASAGITDVGMVVGTETAVGIQQNLGDGSDWSLKITYIHQEHPLGLAHCVLVAEDFLGDDSFVMYLGDNMLNGGIHDFASAFSSNGANAQVQLFHVRDPSEFGVAEFSDNGELKRLVEKPKVPPSHWAMTGIYFFDHKIIEAAHAIKPSWRNELEITDATQWLMDNGFKVGHQKLGGWWKDTGQPTDLLEANVLVLQDLIGGIDESAIIDDDTQIIGHVKVESGVQITRSVIRGPVIIGAGSVIEGSYIGASTSLGERCVVRNTEVACSIIMEGAKLLDVPVPIDWSLIGREAIVHKTDNRPQALNLVLGDVSSVALA